LVARPSPTDDRKGITDERPSRALPMEVIA